MLAGGWFEGLPVAYTWSGREKTGFARGRIREKGDLYVQEIGLGNGNVRCICQFSSGGFGAGGD